MDTQASRGTHDPSIPEYQVTQRPGHCKLALSIFPSLTIVHMIVYFRRVSNTMSIIQLFPSIPISARVSDDHIHTRVRDCTLTPLPFLQYTLVPLPNYFSVVHDIAVYSLFSRVPRPCPSGWSRSHLIGVMVPVQIHSWDDWDKSSKLGSEWYLSDRAG